jgi:hypothetical protein
VPASPEKPTEKAKPIEAKKAPVRTMQIPISAYTTREATDHMWKKKNKEEDKSKGFDVFNLRSFKKPKEQEKPTVAASPDILIVSSH